MTIRPYALLIYVAGPIGKPEVHRQNQRAAIDVAEEVYRLGHIPIVPHLMMDWNDQHPHSYEDWMALDFELIRRCDVLLRMEGVSPGADREVAFALRCEKHVCMSLADLAARFKRPRAPEPTAFTEGVGLIKGET